MEPIFWDRGWRIFGEGVSGKRTVFKGESRLIKVSPGEKGVRMGVEANLGHEVGERKEGGKHPTSNTQWGQLGKQERLASLDGMET
jgi:hypothetical protein